MAGQNMYLVIRTSREDDLPAVLILMNQLSNFTQGEERFELEHLQKLHLEMSNQPDFYYNLVCEKQGKIVGFLSLIFYRTLYHRGGTALINELIIDEGQRGQGLGGRLIERAVAEARRRGMDEIEVGTEKSNLAAQKFYRQAGFDEEYLLLGIEFDENSSL